MKKKVFISSTYSDLIDERKKVWDELKNLNLEILGMEDFGARTPSPLDTCIEEVKKCDIYVGIIGMRYGSVDQGKKSYTMIEYETALHNNKEILIYLIDERKSLIPPANVDIEYHDKLKAFKNILKANHTIDYFYNKDQLSLKLIKKLKELGITPLGYRPKILKAKIHRFISSNQNLLLIIAYQLEKPFEIYIAKAEDSFYLPKYLHDGEVIENLNENGDTRMDFRYNDKDGFRVTIEGLSSVNNAFNILFTELLKNDVSINVILSAFEKVNLEELNLNNDLKESLIQIFSRIK